MAASMKHMEKEEKVVFPLKSGASLVNTPPIFATDSKCVFCCSNCVVKVYSTASRECVRELNGHKAAVTGLAINPNNSLQLISCSFDTFIIVWDYQDGILLRKLSLSSPLYGLYTAVDSKSLFVLKSSDQKKSAKECMLIRHTLVAHKKKKADTDDIIFTGCSRDRKLTAVGPEAAYFVTMDDVDKKSWRVRTKEGRFYRYQTDYDVMTCVACHPRDLCIATGCKDGKIIIWYKFLTGSEVITHLHWHSLPVKHLTYTVDGSYLMSGGHECVLVKWHFGTQNRDFLPRLSAPINSLICSKDNTLLALAQEDNVITVISSSFEAQFIIQGLTKGHGKKSGDPHAIPAGLSCDPKSRSLVLNGRPGHIQFYSLQEDKQLYNLDIVQQNFISPENLKQPLAVTEVTGACFDTTGTWLATTEYWHDGIMNPEIRLKFWLFDESLQSYVLNTTVELPHEHRVASLQFRPHSDTSSLGTEHMLVTSSSDGKFKIWLLVDDTDIYRKNTKWSCESVGYYQDLPASKISFSEDGSLLAVVFDSKITLWEPEICLLKRTLIHSMNTAKIRHIEFGHCECSQYLVSCTTSQLVVWNLVTCTVSWTVDLKVASLAADPLSDVMAVFTNYQDCLFVFKPSSPNPVFSHVAVSEGNVLYSVFIPQSQKNLYEKTTLAWQNASQLYFINKQQELRTVTFEVDSEAAGKQELMRVEENLPQTALSLLVSSAGKTSQEVEVTKPDVPREPSGAYLKEMLLSASHVLPSVTSLCQPFINSLLIGEKQSSSDKKLDEEDEEEEVSETSLLPWKHLQTGIPDSGVDSDMEVDLPSVKTDSAVSQSSGDKTREKQSISRKDSKTSVKQFSDSDITEILAENTDWYSNLKTS